MNPQAISGEILERLYLFAGQAGLSVDDFLLHLLDAAPQPHPSEIPYRLLLEHTTDGISLFDPDLRYVYVNPIFGPLTGLDPADMIGKTDRELGMPEANVAQWRDAWDAVIETRQEHILTFDYATPDGVQTFESRLTPIYDHDNEQLTYLLAMTRDVTDRNQTKKMLQDIADHLPGMVLRYRLYPDGTDAVPFVSKGISHIYEISAEEALADIGTVWAKVHPDDVPAFAKSIQVSAEKLSLWEYEWRIRMDDGSLKWVAGLGTPHRLEDGSTLWHTLVLDITDRKRAEARHLEVERLRIEMEEKRKLVELKERLIATASHDFRTPLTVIQTTASMLETYDDRFTPQQKREKLQILQDQVDFMTHLLDEVLTISKAQASKLDVSMRTIELRPFARAIWDNVVIIDTGAHLKTFNFSTTVDKFVGDPHLLRQVFENLLSNALKYTPEGKRVTFEVSNTERWLTFTVADEGYGIPVDDQPYLFEPFYRARNVSKLDGTGLGLTIARDFVASHNGDIAFESKEGEGTTFTVRLPISQAEQPRIGGNTP